MYSELTKKGCEPCSQCVRSKLLMLLRNWGIFCLPEDGSSVDCVFRDNKYFTNGM